MKILFVLCLLLLFPLSAGAEEEVTPTPEPTPMVLTMSPDEVTLEETLLVKRDGVTITAKSLELGGFFGPSLRLEIHNDTQQDITVEAPGASINGCMARTMFSCEVLQGKKAVADLIFLASDLSRAGIEYIREFDLRFHVLQTDSWETLFLSNPVIFNTNVDKKFKQRFDTKGLATVEKNGVEVTFQKLERDETGTLLQVCVQNTSKQDVTVSLQDVSVNDYMIDCYFSCEVAAGKIAYDVVVFSNTEIEKNGIEKFQHMECVVYAHDALWQTLLRSDVVSMDF